MRITPTYTYDPHDLSTYAWVVNFRLIDANTHVLSPSMTTNVHDLNPKPSIASLKLKSKTSIEATNKHLSAASAMVIMDPYEATTLMRLNASLTYNGFPSTADTLIDTATLLTFGQ